MSIYYRVTRTKVTVYKITDEGKVGNRILRFDRNNLSNYEAECVVAEMFPDSRLYHELGGINFGDTYA